MIKFRSHNIYVYSSSLSPLELANGFTWLPFSTPARFIVPHAEFLEKKRWIMEISSKRVENYNFIVSCRRRQPAACDDWMAKRQGVLLTFRRKLTLFLYSKTSPRVKNYTIEPWRPLRRGGLWRLPGIVAKVKHHMWHVIFDQTARDLY